jgi:hypothetical protein
MYYLTQLKASTVFVILHFMASDCSSVPIHMNATAPKNSSNSAVHFNSISKQINEDTSTMKKFYGSESEANPIFHGNQTKNNVNAKTSTTFNINKNLTEEDSHNNIHTIRSKRSTQCNVSEPSLSISSAIQKWVNYLVNYKASCNECHNHCSVNISEVCSCKFK